MNTETTPIFTDEVAEYIDIQSGSPSIDLSDWELSPGLISTFNTNPNFFITAPIGQLGYYEVEFHLANNFWGCNFSFGNSLCGVHIRQGIAHLFDKSSFTTHEPSIAGLATPIDSAVPTTSAGGLPEPNPCHYDLITDQDPTNTNPACIVGDPSALAFHINAATGANGVPWLYAPGSTDLNLAAQHFVAAGVAAGFNAATSQLTGIVPAALANVPNFFIRSDNAPRLSLGNTISENICYLFTGSYSLPCAYLSIVRGPITAFPGFTTSISGVNLNWWMYTAAFSGPTFFDGSLYFGYNSRFVSGVSSIQKPTGTCDAQSVPTASAGNYEYQCSPTYDSASTQMENAPCLSATGDPTGHSNTPSPGTCPTGPLSAISAGVTAEAIAGAGVFTLPIMELTVQYGYLQNTGFQRAINNAGLGLPNFFTWLNAWSGSSSTLRQGFKETTKSVNPYISSTVWDTYIMGNIYDSLYASNPLAPAQLINWMTESTAQLSNSSLIYNGGVAGAPAHTLTTYRFTLRPDLFFQDGRPVTSYDVAFSYLSMVGTGAFLGTGATSMTGVTILNPHQFDIGVNSQGPFILPSLTAIPIVSARYWTNAGSSSWDSAVSTCTTSTCLDVQYTLSGPTVNCVGTCSNFPASNQQINPSDVTATFDPITAHNFVGSGPWQCGTVTSSGSGSCSSSGSMNPPQPGGSYTLTRFGNGLPPASSISGIYFRSSGNLALYLWSQQNDQNPLLAFVAVASCYQLAVNLAGTCGHFQQGIGNPGSGTPVGVNQVSVSSRFYNLNWLAPFEWATTPPSGIGALPPVLYEGSVTLTPAPSPSACNVPNTFYNC
jgi:hypothetical protein